MSGRRLQARAGDSALLSVFQQGEKVRLKSKASGKNLRVRDGNVDGNGGDGEFATFIVHVKADDVVALQSMPDPSRWLRITADGTLDGKGSGHQWTEFRVKPIGSDAVALESVVFPAWHVGILPTGETKPGKNTHTGLHGQFYPYKPSVFQQGAKVRLKSKASGKNLRIRDGNVDGNGGDGEFSTFIVHVKADGVVQLQSMPDPSRWLRITADGTLDGKGSGHQWTEFRVNHIGSDSVALESVVFPAWHVGILPTGETKPGKNTHTGLHGQFYPYKP